MIKRYQLPTSPPPDWSKQLPELHPTIATILYHLNIRTTEQAERFLHPTYDQDQHDPFLFKDMSKVVARLIAARDQQENVTVYGDYDADGVCAGVLLYTALKDIGVKSVNLYLPHRDTEGYGLNRKAIDQFVSQGVKLLITVDCGISNAVEVAYAVEHGIEVIVTDHHVEPLQLPDKAFAIINPQVQACGYPWPMLAGVGVAFKVVQALGRTLKLSEGFEKWLLDLVAISTITDCMPLRDENRTLLKYGLVVLNKTRRLGLQKLIAATHKPGAVVTTGTIGFRIGPWINAAGRIDHANMAVKLLLSETAAEAEQCVQILGQTNTERQTQTERMFAEAKIVAAPQIDQPLLAVYGEHWPLGLIGLVAGKLVNEFHKPAFVMTENQGMIFGSGRSVAGVNLIKTLQGIEVLLDRYGGHAMACGFTLKSTTTRELFTQTFMEAARTSLEAVPEEKMYTLAAELNIADITWELIEQLEWLEPFGEQNPEPLFSLPRVIVKDFQTVGATNKHLRFILTDEQGKKLKAIAFGMGDRAAQLKLGDQLHCVGCVSVNEWNGHREIQFQVKDII